MSKTDQYPETLAATIASIRDSLPQISEPPAVAVEEILATQDTMSTSMAAHLESLASHYDQMAAALRDGEAGEAFSDEDLQGTGLSIISEYTPLKYNIADMNRDTNELPLIMAELEESADAIDTQQYVSATSLFVSC